MTSNHSTPISQEELERKLEDGESLEGVVIGDADFSKRTFKKTLNFSGAVIQGTLKFWKSNFSGNFHVNFCKAQFSDNSYLVFVEANFSGTSWVNFNQSRFSGEAGVNFSGATIGGEVSLEFSQVEFSKKACACFSRTLFSGKIKVRFGSNTKFSDESYANFSKAIFSREAIANFRKTQFSDKAHANFSSSSFSKNSYADFSYSNFSEESYVSFSNSKIFEKSKINFFRTKFSSKAYVNISRAQFSNEAVIDFSESQFSGETWASLQKAHFLDRSELSWINIFPSNHSQPWFEAMKCAPSAKIRFESSNLSQASFYKADIEGFTFKNITWGKVRGGFIPRFVLKDEELFEINQKEELKKLDENPELSEAEKKKKKRELEIDYFRQVEILYRQLKRNYEEKRDYHGAGDFHFGELEMRRRQKTWFRQWTSLTLPYRLFSGYGEKWGRALLSFFIAVLLSAGLNLLWIQPKQHPLPVVNQGDTSHPTPKNLGSKNPVKSLEFVDSFLFTFKLMTLQRNLKYEPIDDPLWGRVGKFVLNLEFLIGPALIALMLLAIRRQFRR